MRRLLRQSRMRNKPENTQAVVDRHHNHAVLDQRSVLIECARCRAPGVGSAMKPDHNRQHRGRLRRRPHRSHNVQKQAVFFAGFRVAPVPVSQNRLRAWSTKCCRVAHSVPRLRRHEARASVSPPPATARKESPETLRPPNCRVAPLSEPLLVFTTRSSAAASIWPEIATDKERSAQPTRTKYTTAT